MVDSLEEDARRFGSQLRAFRTARGMSLSEVEKRSDVSRSMLSKIERGQASPTIQLASRIAKALETSLSRLLGAADPRSSFIVARQDERQLFRDVNGFLRELLVPVPNEVGVEVARHTIPANGASGQLPAYAAGTRKILVVEFGTVRICAGGSEALLQPGDALYFEADVPHEFSNPERGECAYTLIVIRR